MGNGKLVAVPGIGNISFPADMADADINSAIEQELAKRNPKPAPQQLLNAPNQPGLQPTTSAWDHLKNAASDLYTNGTVPGMVSAAAKVGQAYLNQKANQVSSPGSHPIADTFGALTGVPADVPLRMGADTAGLISGANSPTGMAVAGATVAAPAAAGVGMIGYGGYKAYQNKDALINLMTKGQANPQQAQEGLMGLGTMAGGASLAGGALSPAKPQIAPEVQNANVAKIVTDTVNPPAKAIPAFEKNVQAQLPEVLQGRPVPKTRAELQQAFRETADKAKQDYYESYINPAKDVEVSTTYVPNYSGSTKTYNTATVAQLDSRLSEINADLRQFYEKGGEASRASLQGGKSPGELNAEAAGIRSVMNKAVAKETGAPIESVAAGRQKFGQMYDVADKMELALNKERHVQNEANKQPISLESSATGIALRKAGKVRDRAIGKPADRAVRKALR